MHRKAGLSSRLVFISVLLVRWGVMKDGGNVKA